MGDFNNPNNNAIWGSTGFNVSGEENGASFLGTLLGTKTDNTLRGIFNSFYIRADGEDGFLAGAVQTFDLEGNFVPATGMFGADGVG